jgi:hypothetical protein
MAYTHVCMPFQTFWQNTLSLHDEAVRSVVKLN